MSPLKFEVCVDSIAGIRAAREADAERVELCANLLEGGITPSLGTILVARKVADIKLHVMIRPRGGDFLYDEDEIATMEADIASAKSAGVDGVVFGVLERDGRIDLAATERLVARARPVSVTFHRAFDMTPEPLIALETLIELGVDRILTSGQEPTAYEGAERIAELIKAAVGRLIVMPGGGITARNASRVAAITRSEGAAFRGAGADRQRHALPPRRGVHGRRACDRRNTTASTRVPPRSLRDRAAKPVRPLERSRVSCRPVAEHSAEAEGRRPLINQPNLVDHAEPYPRATRSSTIVAIISRSSPSAMTRMTGSVPEARTSRRPLAPRLAVGIVDHLLDVAVVERLAAAGRARSSGSAAAARSGGRPR